MPKGTLSKKQRERKKQRETLNQVIGNRLEDWRNFVKKDNDKNLTEEQIDRREGERMLKEMDEKTGLSVTQHMEAESLETLPDGSIMAKGVRMVGEPEIKGNDS